MPDGTREPLDEAVARIRAIHGEGAIMSLGDESRDTPIEGISTGCPSLDRILGGAGFPRGRIAEIFGPEASGKTTLALSTLAQAQKKGGVGVLIDTEHALFPPFARAIGVDTSSLLVSQPDHGEQAFDIADQLLRSGSVDCLILDSVAALVPKAELEGEFGDDAVDPARQARLVSSSLRRLVATIGQTRAVVLFVNQLRSRVGTLFGSPETTPGGRALKFYASVRLELAPVEALEEGAERIGMRVRARVVKNKIAPPFRSTEFDILYDRGVNFEGDLVELGVAAGVVETSGAWYSFAQTRLGKGRLAAAVTLSRHPDLVRKLEEALGL